MTECKYITPFLDGTIHCGAYVESKRPDGKLWAHFPKCANKNCPLEHPKLLGNAILETGDKTNEEDINHHCCNTHKRGLY